ncbi:MAG: hypothetical protein IJU23_14225 [Proteobacteria bacterium]|nr:hypothetical protein [Pseudomonadota bacterium]
MNDSLRRRLALACCAAIAMAATACSGDSAGTSVVEMCGDTVCLENEVCKDNACVPNVDPCSLCTENQDCVNGTCKDKVADPCEKCTANQKCVDKVCTDLCGTAICGSNQACVNEECVKLCGEELCTEDQICDKNVQKCIPKPVDVDPCTLCSPDEICVDKQCKPADPCANKTCPDNWRCDPTKNGACVEIDPCETAACPTAQTCLNGRCYDDGCLIADDNGNVAEKTCDEGQECSKGQCIDSLCKTLPEPCADGWQCIKGICEETACINYHCEEGRSCRGGKCVDNECLDMTCSDDKVCSKGNCIYPACLDKPACTTGKTCNEEGNCVFITAPAISLDVPEDKTTDEKGKTLPLALHLNNAPGQDVHVSCEVLTTSQNKEVDVACDEIVFNADNWQLEQTILITGVADYLIDGDQTYTIKVTTSSEDKDFDALVTESVVLTNLDTTQPGIVVSETSLMTYEDTTADPATFTVALTSIPATDVTLKLHSSNETEGTVSPATLTFTKDNWNKPQTVTVTGVDDQEHDGNVNYTVYFEPSISEDENYQGLQGQPIKVTNVDNDVAGISMNLASEGFELNEGQTQNLTVKLNTKPKNDVKIALATNDTTEASFDVAEITLTTSTWNTGREIQLNGVADHIIDGDQPIKLTLTATSTDADYNLAPIEYSGTVKDIDTANLIYSLGASPNVMEGKTDTVALNLHLSSKPASNVTVDVIISDSTELKADKTAITITPDKWDETQQVLFSSVDDYLVDGSVKSKVTLKLTTDDTHFAGISKEIEFTTLDNDEAGFIVTSTPASYAENSSATDTMTVALKAQPEYNVTVTVASSDATELAVTSSSTLTFTKDNWNTPQTVTFTVVDDNIADGSQMAYVSFTGSSSDPNFNEIKAQSATFTIIDNESASVALAVAPDSLNPGVTSSTATISLGASPLSTMTVTLMAEHSDIITFVPPTLTFTSSNWATPQNVTVNVNFNAIMTASAVENIWATTSGDITYAGVESNPVALTLYTIPTVQDFEYTGTVQKVRLPIGTYKLEVWGAQGGNASVKTGGRGGYSKGILSLSESTDLYIYVGQQGISSISGKSQEGDGGWNGGGNNITAPGSPWIVGTGGGATDISLRGTAGSSNWNNSEHLYSRIIVAGGGGAAQYREDSLYGGNGGGGGGSTGLSGDYINSGYSTGTGGTQSAGGSPCSAKGGTGSFGTGGNYIGKESGSCVSGGGGGGWYGGGSCYCGSAAGGSGYTYSSASSTYYPAGVLLDSRYYLTNTQTTGGATSVPAPIGGTEMGHQGNGYARITLQ